MAVQEFAIAVLSPHITMLGSAFADDPGAKGRITNQVVQFVEKMSPVALEDTMVIHVREVIS